MAREYQLCIIHELNGGRPRSPPCGDPRRPWPSPNAVASSPLGLVRSVCLVGLRKVVAVAVAVKMGVSDLGLEVLSASRPPPRAPLRTLLRGVLVAPPVGLGFSLGAGLSGNWLRNCCPFGSWSEQLSAAATGGAALAALIRLRDRSSSPWSVRTFFSSNLYMLFTLCAPSSLLLCIRHCHNTPPPVT
jgi:hypothetical protein